MPSHQTQPDRTPGARRPSVRIIKPRTTSRVAILSLLTAAVAAMGLPAIWRYWRSEELVRPAQRTFSDVELEWRCSAGHTFQAAGQLGGRTCWKRNCERQAFPSTQYACSVHGSFLVQVRFENDERGTPKPARLRLPSGGWVSVEKGLKCPRCPRKLEYRGANPLDRP